MCLLLRPYPRQQPEAVVRAPQRDTEDIAGSRAHHALVLFRRAPAAAGLVDHGIDPRGEGGRNRPADACGRTKGR